MNLAELFHARASTLPGENGIIAYKKHSGQAMPLLVMERESGRYAEKLQRAGLQPGDAVLVFYPMSVELYVALLAIFRLGLVAIFIDPSAGKEHLERCCELHPPKALIASTKAHLLRFVAPALRHIPHKYVIGLPVFGATTLQRVWPDGTTWLMIPGVLLRMLIGSLGLPLRRRGRIVWETEDDRQYAPESFADKEPATPCPMATRPPMVAVADDHPALITFTSGSTGEPKAALRTHGFLQAQHRVLEKSLLLTPGDRNLTTLPIFVVANLASGVMSVLPAGDLRYPGALEPALVVRTINEMKVHSSAASPALLERLADYCLARQIQLTSFQKIFTGGAPVFPRLLDKLRRVAPNAHIVAVYGSTEAEPIAKIALADIRAEDRNAMQQGRGLLAGKPVPEIQLRILRDQWGTPLPPLTPAQFAADCLPLNQPGEIVVAGEHVLTGYLHGRGDEETKFQVEGKIWHRTGDAGYVDAEGRLWLLGRCAAKLIDARGTLFPFAVECAASHHPNVKRAALVSHEGRRLLLVELHERAAGAGDLLQTLAWAVLDEVRVIKQIPVDKRHNAKVDYPALRKLL